MEPLLTTIKSHYNGISTTNYTGAYDYFSSSRKGKVTFEGWKKGLQNTLRDNVTDWMLSV